MIVGTGHAGSATALQLRQLGFSGSIALVGAEREPPYERPPLSKDYLAGSRGFEQILVRPEAFWAERAIAVITGVEVTAIEPAARRATAADGRGFVYSDLVWTAGGHARPLPCAPAGLGGVHAIRSRADVDALRAELEPGQRWVIVGGGYIGLEAAAVLSTLGVAVTLVESAPRLLARVSADPLASFVADEHRARGIDLRLATDVVGLEGDARVTGVRLGTGETVPADGVIVGIGLIPNVAALLAAGADGSEQGVAVDGDGRTSLPHIWAAGDCTLARNAFGPDRPIRIESVGNAADGAAAIARAIVGAPHVPVAPPWFWSNQYDLKLQTVGLSHDHDEIIVRGDPATRRFALLYRRDGAVIAADCVNNVRDYVQSRGLITSRRTFDPIALADPDIPLKSLLEP